MIIPTFFFSPVGGGGGGGGVHNSPFPWEKSVYVSSAIQTVA